MKIPRRRKASVRPVTRKEEDGDSRIENAEAVRGTTKLGVSQHVTTKGSDNTPPLIRILQNNCNHSHTLCMAPFKREKRVGADILSLQEPYVSGVVLTHPTYEIKRETVGE